MGWDVGCHANSDTRGAVYEQVRYFGREDGGLLERAIVVRDEVHGLLLDVLEDVLCDLLQTGFGVSHGGCAVPIHRAEVSLAVDERIPEREVLGHSNKGIVDRHIPVGVILAKHITNDAGRLGVGLARGVSASVHGVEYPSVNRLQSVSHIGKCTSHDDAHGIVDI